jgi:hypothetical protein
MRNEMVGAVVRRAMEHPEFRRRLLDNPQDALEAHGFALESREMDEIDRIRRDIQDHSGPDAEQRLKAIAEEFGISPGR